MVSGLSSYKIARGEESGAIALALHQAVAKRITGMVRRVGLRERVIFAGGVAQNRCLQKLLSERLALRLPSPASRRLSAPLVPLSWLAMGHKYGRSCYAGF
jgi:activator of 2-hydroxyglutaryl-CoA dehydratase